MYDQQAITQLVLDRRNTLRAATEADSVIARIRRALKG